MARFASDPQFADVCDGFAFDYEVHYDTVPPDPHFCVLPSCFYHVKAGQPQILKSLPFFSQWRKIWI